MLGIRVGGRTSFAVNATTEWSGGVGWVMAEGCSEGGGKLAGDGALGKELADGDAVEVEGELLG